MATARRIPEGHAGVIAYLTVDGASLAIDFYKTVFGAKELMRLADDEGHIGHAELKIGDGLVMLSDAMPQYGRPAPRSGTENGFGMHLYVEDVDGVFRKAVEAGAKPLHEPSDEFYGDRAGRFEDPFGHRWMVSSHVEDVCEEEIQRRFDQFVEQHRKAAGERAKSGQQQKQS